MLIEPFVLRAAATGLTIAAVGGVVGCFLLWKRAAYFGEATAHAAFPGIAIALLAGAPVFPAILLSCLVMAGAASLMAHRRYSIDAALALLSHTMLASGVILLSLSGAGSSDLSSWLFGEILSVSPPELTAILAGSLLVAGCLVLFWTPLVDGVISEEIACAEGRNPFLASFASSLVLAALIALVVRVTGVLLLVSMLVIPAAAARPLARSPEGMAVMAALAGAVSALSGLALSLTFDFPAAPSIVVSAFLLLVVTNLVSLCRRRDGPGRGRGSERGGGPDRTGPSP